MESKKDIFKILIKEFHQGTRPLVIRRDVHLPDWCLKPKLSGRHGSQPSMAVAVTGPRRCGKTYILLQIIEQLCSRKSSPLPANRLFYFNFEDDRLLPLEASDLANLLDAIYELYPDHRNQEIVIFLDEIHHVQGWDSYVRQLLDQKRVTIFFSGSSSTLLSRMSAEPAASRVLEIKILPLSFREFLVFKGLEAGQDPANSELRYKIRYLLDEYLLYGGYPEVVLADLSLKFQLLKNYFDILIYKDLVEGFSVRNIVLLKGLLKHLVTSVGSSVSLNAYYLGLPPESRVSRETILEYVSYFEQRHLIDLVPLFSDSEKTRQVNPRRAYCLDNGIRNAVSFQLAQDEERLARNVIFRALKRRGGEIFYWKGKGDVDFVVREDGRIRGIRLSYGREMDGREVAPLIEFRNTFDLNDEDLEIITKDTEKTDKGVRYTPLWKWLLNEESKAG